MKSENPLPAFAEKVSSGKINYIDHLKVLMIVLVVLHHTFITYGAPGGWYFQDKTTRMGALFPMTVFVATNQSFFMGFFFFLSALFIGPSYQKKGAAKFLTDRLKRLGIPLVFYSFLFSPLLNYMVTYWGYGRHYSLFTYLSGYDDWIDFGVLWFVAALLLFNLFYLIYKRIPGLNFSFKFSFPPNKQIIWGALCLGLVSFFTRLIFPTGWSLKPLGFQLGYFPQYILLFVLGIIATKNNWLNQLNLKQGKSLVYVIVFLVIIILPGIFIASLITKTPANQFNGGRHIFAFVYCLWEQVTGILIMTALLCIAKFKWNDSTPFLKWLSANAFAVYIFHPAVVISLSLLLLSWAVDPAIKLLVAAPLAVIFSFALAAFIRKVPFVARII